MITAEESITTYLMPREAEGLSLRAKRHAEAGQKAHEVYKVLRDVCGEFGLTIEEPNWQAGGNPEDVELWCKQLIGQMHSDKIGRITYEEEHADFFWFEECTKKGILNNEVTKVKKHHRVVNPRLIKIPVPFDVPPKARRILNKLESVEPLRRACRVVTGNLVGHGERKVGAHFERTALGKGLDSIWSFTKDAAVVTGYLALAAVAVPVAAGVVAAGSLKSAFMADPAIVCGDLVFYGWKD